jgi:hypothetical protein
MGRVRSMEKALSTSLETSLDDEMGPSLKNVINRGPRDLSVQWRMTMLKVLGSILAQSSVMQPSSLASDKFKTCKCGDPPTTRIQAD